MNQYLKRIELIFVIGFLLLLMQDHIVVSLKMIPMPAGLSLSFLVMIESSIAFIDSGIGGLPYLNWIRRRRPDLPVAYLADSANFPYGDMSTDEVRKAVVEAVEKLLGIGTPRLLVVACNTASVTALEDIREIAPCPVVGTVPAVKPAAGLNIEGAIGVLATSGTVDSPYLDSLVSAFASEREVVRVAAGDIVRFVEERWLDEGDKGAIPVMERAINSLTESGVVSIVLGCTHFLHLLNPIKQMVGSGIPLVDSRDGVGRRILSLLGEKSTVQNEHTAEGVFFVTKSGFSDERYRRFAAIEKLRWAGEII